MDLRRLLLLPVLAAMTVAMPVPLGRRLLAGREGGDLREHE
ncbi:MAG: hypothetical protein ACTHLC_00760 [Rhizobiaceae bacterium]|jgi:hypothetical protein